MKTKLLSLLLCLVLCTALVPAALAEECTCEAHWGNDFYPPDEHDSAAGSGTMEEAIAAAEANPDYYYITPVANLLNAAYTINDGNSIWLDFDCANVSAAAGKSAFTVTGSAHVYINWMEHYFNGSEACITVNGSGATVELGESIVFTAADNKPAIRLLDGTVLFRGVRFGNPDASCDIEYTNGTLQFDTTEHVNGVTIQNKGATLAVDSDAFRDAIQLPEDFYLVENGKTAKAVSFENGKTYTVKGPIIATFDCGYNGSDYGVETPADKYEKLPVPGELKLSPTLFTHPDPAMKLVGWEYWDEELEENILLAADASFQLKQNTYFTAIWDDGKANVTFRHGYLDETHTVYDVPYGPYTLPACPFTHPHAASGFVFDGWYYTEGGKEWKAESPFDLQADMYFSAKWKDVIPSGWFYPGDGEGTKFFINAVNGQITLPGQGSFTHPNPAMKFMGWEYYDYTEGKYVILSPGSVPLTEDTSFTAIWDDGVNTLTFCPNNGEADFDVVPTGSTYTLPTPAAFENAVFKGWLYSDPETDQQILLPAGYAFPVTGDAEFDAVWTGLWVNNAALKNGEYMSNSGVISKTQPSGGYAHYANGVLTLHDFEGRRIYASAINLTIVLEGSSHLENDENEALEADFSSLIIRGEGSLKLVTDEDDAYDGIELEESSLDIQGGSITIRAGDDGIYSDASGAGNGLVKISGGKLDIVTKDDDGIDTSGVANLLITGGEITIHSDDHGLAGADDGLMTITGGKLNITAGDDGMDATGRIEITGGEIDITAEDIGIDSEENSILISGGKITIFNRDTNGHDNDGMQARKDLTVTGGTIYIVAGENGLVSQAGTLNIFGGDQYITVIDPNGLALAGHEALVIRGMKIPEGLTIGKAKDGSGDEHWTLLYNGLSRGSWTGESMAPPSTGDSTPLALLAVLMALSACGMLMLRRRRG